MTVTDKALVRVGEDLLTRTWTPHKSGFAFLFATDHKSIGLRFMITAMVFFVAGGIEAVLLRAQLAQPQAGLIGPEAYNQIFTMHGTTMMFFFAVPVLEGLGLYLVPLMIGSRDAAFPRMNAFAYWIYLVAGVALYASLFLGAAPNAGWFSYPTLTLREFTPIDGVDVWALAITLLEFSALTMAVTLVVTILKHRAPGMTLGRMPLFVWAMLVFGFMIVFAMPSLVAASIMLEMDRTVGTHFFNPAEGGDPILWQHLFWWFAHPEVYIIFIPAAGIIATILPAFTRREVVGYSIVALSFVATGFISFAVWAHHMFATGLPRIALGFFSVATFMVAIPSGIQVFSWLATVWSSHRLVFSTAFLFSAAWVVTFVFGGISGVTLASVPFNRQVHDTFYVVGHFHYVLVGGMVLPLFAGFYYWFPKFTGRLLSERLGRWNFWLVFAALNLAFFPMHLSGLWGMPRRVYTYHGGLGLELPNLISSIGAFLFVPAALLFVFNVVRSLKSGAPAGPDPWGANTLEWSVSSPPPAYSFRDIPTVRSRNPLWMQEELAPTAVGTGDPAHPEMRVAVEMREDRRETIVTTVVNAELQGRTIIVGPSVWPFFTAVATCIAIIGVLQHPVFVVIGSALAFVGLASWHWPEKHGGPVAEYGGLPPAGLTETPPVKKVPASDLDTCHVGPEAPLWWGMVLFVTIEVVFFGAFVVAYYFLRGFEAEWPPGHTSPPDLPIPIIYTVLLILSSVSMYIGDKGIKQGNQRQLIAGQIGAISLAIGYLVLKAIEFGVFTTYTWYSHAYGSLSWTISGFHAAHVLSVVLKGAIVLSLAVRGYFTKERRLGVQINGLYWHFVVLIWIPLFITLYLTPRI